MSDRTTTATAADSAVLAVTDSPTTGGGAPDPGPGIDRIVGGSASSRSLSREFHRQDDTIEIGRVDPPDRILAKRREPSVRVLGEADAAVAIEDEESAAVVAGDVQAVPVGRRRATMDVATCDRATARSVTVIVDGQSPHPTRPAA